jgi:hypothetical protein
MNKQIALFCLLSCLFPRVGAAQRLSNLQNIDVRVKGLIRPLVPLPDSIKTYRIIAEIVADPSFTSVDETVVESAFQLESFEKRIYNPDMTLRVKVKDHIQSNVGRSRLDTITKQTYYWYEEYMEPEIQTVLQDKWGKTLYAQNGGIRTVYRTPDRKTLKEAQFDYANKKHDPVYAGHVTDGYYKTLKDRSLKLRVKFDHQPETVSLYHPSDDDDPVFVKKLEVVKVLLRMVNNGRPNSAILAELQPEIDYLKKELAVADRSSKKGKYRYYACALNLANIYRCFDLYDRALSYAGLLIEDHYYQSKDLTAHLANEQDLFAIHEYYKKTGNQLSEGKRKLFAARIDSIRQYEDPEGRIVLKNDVAVEGTILNFINNFNNARVKLKYEKKLNAPIGNAEYLLEDIKEIHLEGSKFTVVPHASKYYLAVQEYQSPKIALYRALPALTQKDTAKKEFAELCFLKKYNLATFLPVDNGPIGNVSQFMNDCPKIADRVKYGYYTFNRLLEAVTDYDTTCVFKLKIKREKKKTTIRKIDAAPIKSPGFYLGLGSGSNNFSSQFGITSAFRLKNNLFGRLALGAGEWGPKYAVGLKYDLKSDMKYSSGWSFAAGYAHVNTWKRNIVLSIASDESDSTAVDEEIAILGSPVNTVNISTIFNKFLGKKTVLLFEFGYALNFEKEPWVLVDIGKAKPKEARKSIKLAEPGGIILGFGISWVF